MGNLEQNYDAFKRDLVYLLNKHAMEYGSDTPDFILAEYLTNCLRAFDRVTETKTKYNES